MLIDWLAYGAVIWGLVALINRYYFNEQPASQSTAWILTISIFFVNLLAMTALQYFRYQAISENLGFKIKPQNPLDVVGAFTFAWLFFALLRRQNISKERSSLSSSPVTEIPRTKLAEFQTRSQAHDTEKEVSVQTGLAVLSEEDLWEIAAEEIDGSSRRKGLWAT